MLPEVTAVVTCMTDGERPFIREGLLSVAAQSAACEIVVVVAEANGWIDSITAELPRLRVLRRPPCWPGAARNEGIVASRTEFVAFLDGDDAWLPLKTERQLAHLRKEGGDLIGVDHLLMTEAGRVFAYAPARHMPMTSSWLVRRETMLRHPFDPSIPRGQDGAWWRSTWGQVCKLRLAEPLIRYRVRCQSVSSAAPSKRRKLALARLSELPLAAPALLSVTYVLNRAMQRPHYLPPRSWKLPGNSARTDGRAGRAPDTPAAIG